MQCSTFIYACMTEEAEDFIIDGCEPPCGCWELNSETLEELLVFLTSEPSLQTQVNFF